MASTSRPENASITCLGPSPPTGRRRRPLVLVIGLDGASPYLVRRFIDAGHLPNLAALADRGVLTTLFSTPNAMSPAAWSSFVTGLNPGNHGVFYFLDRVPGTYQTRYVNGRCRAGTPLWSALSAHGLRVCSLFVPLTYPAVKVNGLLASGWLAPSLNDPAYAYPPDLVHRMLSIAPEFRLHTGMTEFVRRGRYAKALERKISSLQAKAKIATELLASESWDLFVVVFDETDPVQHYFWHFFDPGHPNHSREGRCAFGDAILRVYRAADEAIGKLLALTDDDTNVFVISDHGCGPNQRAHLYLRGLLRACGMETPARRTLLSRAAGVTYSALTHSLPSALKHRMAARFRRVHERIEALSFAGDIDWSATRAYTFWSSGCSEPWINLRGREPQGIVEPGAEYDMVADDITIALLTARDALTGRLVAESVLRRENVYWGPYLDRAPDLLVNWRPDLVVGGLRCATGILNRDGLAVTTPIAEDLRTATHRLEGLLITHGPNCRSGPRPTCLSHAPASGPQLHPAALFSCTHSINDLAPTIYALLGVPPPHPLDGRPWHDLFGDALTVLRPTCSSIADGSDLPDVDRAILEQRLADLGYL